jgi:alkylation response protein AidB-like acyl-CoA dehydrogenase
MPTPPDANDATGGTGGAGARLSRDVAESAREDRWEHQSFMRACFEGRVRLDLLRHRPPPPDPETAARGERFLRDLEAFVRDRVDGDAIDREGWVPDEVLDGLRELGAFGIKIPVEYGGLGLSQRIYARALEIVASRCASTGAFLSAHQSIGVPQPLLLFGSEAQKRAFLPRIARGALSGFALTEPEVGSDPAHLSTTAHLSEDRRHWILNGRKLWCTNGPRAELLVVMARTPPREGVRPRRPITAFLVETASEGVEVQHLCSFMGLRGISNGVIDFHDVKVPVDQVIGPEGEGLRLALVTLNTGRLSIPAFCRAAAGQGLHLSRTWAAERVQWGQPIGHHEAVALKLGRMAADAFAIEAAVELTSAMADSGDLDLRLEAAITKLWHTETAWHLVNDVFQIHGGRGYETAQSLGERGERPVPVERALRDLRINLVFEGTSEIMRLFIAREAVDMHLEVAGALVDPRSPLPLRARAAIRAALHYAWWYPSRWLGWSGWPRYRDFGALAPHLRFVDRSSRRLARTIFHAMIRFGGGLERRQAVLGRIVDVGAELFHMAAVVLEARRRMEADPSDRSPETLADLFCLQARRRVRDHFRQVFRNDDAATRRVAREALEGRYAWLEEGLILPPPASPAAAGAGGDASAGAAERPGPSTGSPVSASN